MSEPAANKLQGQLYLIALSVATAVVPLPAWLGIALLRLLVSESNHLHARFYHSKAAGSGRNVL
ncbi:hypothetical protein [Microcoleus sp. FACHB-68]|uniref:hypothetical protein n=1 Tax=Microcoleus sp. FACHB-68 TaxID=2692826 RepID=UPI001684BEFA|nr:hypothetical protein [Microcoleus sp. FACHB-68]MBD1940687.1 hypothetical protein [Microcoleus sp. FACHB-68]